jgi:hypothetical protein
MAEDSTGVILQVLSNDTDPDNNITGSISIISTTTNGMLTVNGDNSVSYVPNPNFYGTDVAVYQICDEDSLCDVATITLIVSSVNDTPLAVDDTHTTAYNTPILLPDLLNNDSDPENDVLSILSTTTPGN